MDDQGLTCLKGFGCWGDDCKFTDPLPVGCGAATCALDHDACMDDWEGKAVAVVNSVASIGGLVLTAGASHKFSAAARAATAATKGASSATRTTAYTAKSMKLAAKMSKEALAKAPQLNKAYRLHELQQGITGIMYGIGFNMFMGLAGNVGLAEWVRDNIVHKLCPNYVSSTASAKQHDERRAKMEAIMFECQRVSHEVFASQSDKMEHWEHVKTILGAASMADPTGVIGTIAAFLAGNCEDMTAKFDHANWKGTMVNVDATEACTRPENFCKADTEILGRFDFDGDGKIDFICQDHRKNAAMYRTIASARGCRETGEKAEDIAADAVLHASLSETFDYIPGHATDDEHQRCYNPQGQSIGSHSSNTSFATCADGASTHSKPFFGMEWPQGSTTPGAASCANGMTTLPTAKVADSECGAPHNGRRLGGPWRLAVYKAAAGNVKATLEGHSTTGESPCNPKLFAAQLDRFEGFCWDPEHDEGKGMCRKITRENMKKIRQARLDTRWSYGKYMAGKEVGYTHLPVRECTEWVGLSSHSAFLKGEVVVGCDESRFRASLPDGWGYYFDADHPAGGRCMSFPTHTDFAKNSLTVQTLATHLHGKAGPLPMCPVCYDKCRSKHCPHTVGSGRWAARCGPHGSGSSCPSNYQCCNERNGWCGNTHLRKDAQVSTECDYCNPSKGRDEDDEYRDGTKMGEGHHWNLKTGKTYIPWDLEEQARRSYDFVCPGEGHMFRLDRRTADCKQCRVPSYSCCNKGTPEGECSGFEDTTRCVEQPRNGCVLADGSGSAGWA